MTSPQEITIIGSGIIGLCTAYNLLCSTSTAPIKVTLIESASTIAPGASSKAGGFISRDWHEKASLPLARLSWEEHLKLAKKFNGNEKWEWREGGAIGLRVGEGSAEKSAYRRLPTGEQVGAVEEEEEDFYNGIKENVGGDGGIGAVEPAKFCATLYGICVDLGLITYHAEPLSLHKTSLTIRMSHSGSIASIPHTKLIIAAGPWSSTLCQRLGLGSLPISNLPGHSILLRPSPRSVYAQFNTSLRENGGAVFAGINGSEMGVHASTSGAAKQLDTLEKENGFTTSPEIFYRESGIIFIAGENSIPSPPQQQPIFFAGEIAEANNLPPSVAGVEELIDQSLLNRLVRSARLVSPAFDVDLGAVVVKSQLCYRPITSDGECIIDRIRENVFVAVGHGPWGITLAPGTGKVLSELVLDKRLSCDISGLILQRFKNSKL